MTPKRKRRRRQRIDLAQLAREIGPRARTAWRHARVAVWRFKRSPEQQDRASMIATFAFIGVFAVGSVDAIITGGADFHVANAYAGEMPAPARVVQHQSAETAAELIEATAEIKPATKENVDYSFTTEELLGGPMLAIDGNALIEDAVIEADKVLEMQVPSAAAEIASIL